MFAPSSPNNHGDLSSSRPRLEYCPDTHLIYRARDLGSSTLALMLETRYVLHRSRVTSPESPVSERSRCRSPYLLLFALPSTGKNSQIVRRICS
jgi:hypothetical protein